MLLGACPVETVTVTRYLDDLLITWLDERHFDTVGSLMKHTCTQLTFAWQEPKMGFSKCLGLTLKLYKGLWWACAKKSKKPLLSAKSLNAKLVKAMIRTLLLNLLRRSCKHEVAGAHRDTCERLIGADFFHECRISVIL